MLNDIFIAAGEARGKTMHYFDTELLPFPLTSAGAYPNTQGETQVHTRLLHVQETRGREHLGALVLSMKCRPGAQRSWDTGHDRKHINRQIE